MTNEEIEVVAEELAKLVHVPWAPGYETTPLLDVVTECHRAEARAILAALDQIRPGRSGSSFQASRSNEPQGISCQSRRGEVRPGMTVVYRPPSDQRAYPCRIVEIQGHRAYLAPILRTCVGWISIKRLQVGVEDEVGYLSPCTWAC
jgi:hypothetical protein